MVPHEAISHPWKGAQRRSNTRDVGVCLEEGPGLLRSTGFVLHWGQLERGFLPDWQQQAMVVSEVVRVSEHRTGRSGYGVFQGSSH